MPGTVAACSSPTLGRDGPAATGGGFPGAVAAEWIKLWTVRSTWVCMGAAAVLVSAFAMIAGITSPSHHGGGGGNPLGMSAPLIVIVALLRRTFFSGDFGKIRLRGLLAVFIWRELCLPERFPRGVHKISRHIDLKGGARGEIEKMIFAAERTRGDLLTVQGFADLSVHTRIVSGPNQRERRVSRCVIEGGISRRSARRIGDEGHLAIRTDRKALAIFGAAEGTVHGG